MIYKGYDIKIFADCDGFTAEYEEREENYRRESHKTRTCRTTKPEALADAKRQIDQLERKSHR